MRIHKTTGQKLGITGSDRQCLDVRKRRHHVPIDEVVTGGLVQHWNDEHPDKAVRAGDQIVEVNGIRGFQSWLLEECRQDKVPEKPRLLCEFLDVSLFFLGLFLGTSRKRPETIQEASRISHTDVGFSERCSSS